MKIAELTSKVMLRLATIPGLTFLQSYVVSARGIQTRFGQRKGDYEAFLAAGQGAVGDVRGATGKASGEKKGDSGDEEASTIYDDFDYDENDNSGAYLPLDDYPPSDDRHSYYDDNY